jgi:hypothetical protein
MYDTFEDVLGSCLDHRHSIVALNITGDQFLAHLRTALKEGRGSETHDEVLIVYFSGHGTTYDEVLDLHFVDSVTGQGSVSSAVIGEMLRMFEYPQVLLVLDCCFSGQAKTITQTNTGLNKKRTTLIASSQPWQPSKSGTPVSAFTEHLCVSLYKIQQQGLEISVANLQKDLQNCTLQGQQPHIVLPEGNHDLVLASPPFSGPQVQQLQTDIAARLRTANEGVRESVWYALAEEHEHVLVGVAQSIFQGDKYVEPSWLVRRAAGSALSEIKFLKREQSDLSNQLLNSAHWTNRCVGILTVRRLLNTDSYRTRLEQLLQSSDETMDVRWLALLYLSDYYKLSSFDKLIGNCNLDKFYLSNWGVCELWERCINSTSDDQDFSSIIKRTENFIRNCESHLSILINFIYFRHKKVFDGLDSELRNHLNVALVNTKGIKSFIETRTRGSSQTSGVGKWLHSSLYGSWRGAYRPLPVFHELTTEELAEFMLAAKDVPIIAARMAIFEQLEGKYEIINQHVESISWGLNDPHPWVRRVAVKLFRAWYKENSDGKLEAQVRSAISPTDGKIYPGKLDYLREILHWANQLALPQNKVNQLFHGILNGLSGSDRAALNQESTFESRPYLF